MTARQALDQGLVVMASEGRRPRCAEPGDTDLWTSDDRDERAQAARLCAGCPVLAECYAAADEGDEKFYVWGGIDRSPNRRRKTA